MNLEELAQQKPWSAAAWSSAAFQPPAAAVVLDISDRDALVRVARAAVAMARTMKLRDASAAELELHAAVVRIL